MRVRAVTTVLLAAALTAGCSSQPSYDQVAASCAKALLKRADSDRSKPAVCDGLKEKDYSALLLNVALNKSGMLDKNGNVDVSKLLGS